VHRHQRHRCRGRREPSGSSTDTREAAELQRRDGFTVSMTRMSQAFFAIAGASAGVLGTVLTALVDARHEERRV
jgi:hypothetical protein